MAARKSTQVFLPGEEPTFGISQDLETGLISGVYMIWCRKDRRVYIGSAVDLLARWKSHISKIRTGRASANLRNWWFIWGSREFVFEALEWVEPANDRLNEWEQYYLDIYKASDPRYGLNVEGKVKTSIKTRHR